MKRGVSALVTIGGLMLALLLLPKVEAGQRAPIIVALGDSLTAGFGLAQSDSFPPQLETALKARGHEVRVVNAGVSGDTASAALQRLDWSLPPEASAAIVEFGGNDALQGLPPQEIKAALAEIIERLQAKGLKVLLAGMESPRNMGKDYVEAFGAIYPELAARYNVILYPFFLDGVALNDGLMQEDGIHPNARGVKRIVEGILPKVEELLAEVDAKG